MPLEKNELYSERRLLRSQQLGAVYTARLDPEKFNLTALYAYSQLPDSAIGARAEAAQRFADKTAQKNLDPATIRTILEIQGTALPPETVWVSQGSPKCDLEYFRAHAADLVCLRHPGLNYIYDIWEEEDAPCFAWQPLPDSIPAADLRPGAALPGFRKILDAVEFLHAHGSPHGDIRPDNLWFSQDGGAVLLVSAFRPNRGTAALTDNFTAALFGYTAPEVLHGAEPDTASDIYSLGACLYFLASGVQPFAGAASMTDLLNLQDGARAPFPPQGEIPEKLLAVINRAAATDPQNRYPDVRALAADLDRFLTGGNPEAWETAAAPAEDTAAPAAESARPPLYEESDTFDPAPARPAAAPAFDPRAFNIDMDKTGKRVWRNIAAAAAAVAVVAVGAYALTGKETPPQQAAAAPAENAAAVAPAADTHPSAAPQTAPTPPATPALAVHDAATDGLPTLTQNAEKTPGETAPAMKEVLPALPAPDAAATPKPEPQQTPDAQAAKPQAPLPAAADAARPGWTKQDEMWIVDAALDKAARPEKTAPAPAAPAVKILDDATPQTAAPEPAPSPARQAILRGQELMKKKDYPAALAAFTEAQKLEASDEAEGMITAAKIKIAQTERKRKLLADAQKLAAEKRYAEAETALMQGLSATAGDAELTAALQSARAGKFNTSLADGEKFLKDKQWKEAELAFAWALSVDGYAENPRALAGRKQAQAEIAKAESEKNAREREAQSRKNSFEAAMKEARALLAKKQWQAAQEVLDLALAVPGYEKNEEALTARAQTAAEIQKAADAAALTPEKKAEAARSRAELLRRTAALEKAEMWDTADRLLARSTVNGDAELDALRQRVAAGKAAAARAENAELTLVQALDAAKAGRFSEAGVKLAALGKTPETLTPVASALGAYLKKQTGATDAETTYRAAFNTARRQADERKFTEAAQTFAALARESAAPAVLVFQQGLLLALDKNYPEAVKCFHDAGVRDPKLAAAVLAEALTLLQNQDYAAAFKKAQAYAALAQTATEKNWSKVILGWLYYDGGEAIAKKRAQIDVDNEKAAALFAEAAGADSPEGLCDLAICTLTGRGLRRNAAEARTLLSQAESLPETLFNTGLMYFRGTGISRDYEKAARYFEKAAAKGFTLANAFLADMYRRGRGVAKDAARAEKLMQSAGGETVDIDADFILALPDYRTLYAAAKTVPLPPHQNAVGDPARDASAFAKAYTETLAAAGKLAAAGRHAPAARLYALAQALPGYAESRDAKRGLQDSKHHIAALQKAAAAPLTAAEIKLTPEKLPEPPTAAEAKTAGGDDELMRELNAALGLPSETTPAKPETKPETKPAAQPAAKTGEDDLMKELNAALSQTTAAEKPAAKKPKTDDPLAKILDAPLKTTPPAGKTAKRPDAPAPQAEKKNAPAESTAERREFYRLAVAEAQKMLQQQKPGYAEQGYQLALVVNGIADDSAAAAGLNSALESKRKAGDKIKFTDYEAVLNSAISQLREKQWIAAGNLFKYALTLDGCANEPLAQLGVKIADYELERQLTKNAEKKAEALKSGSERDTASYNIAMSQSRQFINDRNYNAAIQLLKNVLEWEDFKNDPAATAMLKVAEDALAESSSSPEFLAKQREKNKEVYDKLLFSGKVYLQNKRWQEADQNFALALKLKGYEKDAEAARGREAAKKHLTEIPVPTDPKVRAQFKAMLDGARRELAAGRYAKAEEIARAALQLPGCADDADGRAMLEAACKPQGKTPDFADKATSDKMRKSGFVTNDNELERAAARAQYDAFIKEGRKMMETKQYEVAEKIFQEILKMPGYGADPEAMRLLQEATAAKPKAVEVTVPETPQPVDPQAENANQAEVLKSDARRLQAAHNFTLAAQRYGDAISLSPEDAQLYLFRAETYMAQQQLALALADYNKALSLNALSDKEKADAYNAVANIHYYGDLKDYPAAFKNYREAAKYGNAAAMNSLGVAYFTGRGVDADKTLAVDWYKKSAEAGYGNAMLNLGLSYENGWGVDASPTEARGWYEKAAEQKIPRAFARLARIYREGLGVPADAAKAENYSQQAKALGYTAEK